MCNLVLPTERLQELLENKHKPQFARFTSYVIFKICEQARSQQRPVRDPDQMGKDYYGLLYVFLVVKCEVNH